MWCKKCNRESYNEICDICGSETEADIPVEIYWCDDCKTPIINAANEPFRDLCPLCGEKTKYMCADLRPVFPMDMVGLLILKKLLITEFITGRALAFLAY